MMTYLVIGICLLLLIVVIYISAKPISMGIEARRNIKSEDNENIDTTEEKIHEVNKENISDEILKLNQLKNEGILSEEEYKKAKNKLLS
ncbi:SHOCT domain-containing protein [Candidatus Pelagibacter sp.]|nr:SHOCT domain-containing protein [Candidatus Pelagibacter sp.]